MTAADVLPGTRLVIDGETVKVTAVETLAPPEAGPEGDRAPIDGPTFVRMSIEGWPESACVLLPPTAEVTLAA